MATPPSPSTGALTVNATTGVILSPVTAALFKSANGIGSGAGTVTSVSVTTANGVSGTVATATTTPAITLTLGAITPTSISTGALTSSALTSGRVPFASTAGLLTDAAAFTFNSGTGALAATSFAGSGALLTGLVLSIAGTANQITSSASTGAITLSLAGPHDFTSQTSTALLLGNGTSAISSSDLTYATPTLSVPDGYTVSSAGSIALTAGGAAKSITATPSTTGAFALGMAGGGLFKVNYNSVTPAPQAKTTGFWYINADSTQNTWTCDAFATNHSWDVRRANGTAASPTAVSSGDSISTWNAVGFDGVSTYRTGGVLRYKAEENFSATNNGTSLAIELVPVGSNSRSTAFKVFGGGRTQITPTSMSLAAWGVTGSFFSVGAATYTDSSSSGTVAIAVSNSFAVPTFAAASATTVTSAANLYIAGDVANGTNVTLTNSYGIWNVGKTRLDGNALIGTTALLNFGATALGNIGVSADTTAGILQIKSPTSGTTALYTANALSLTLSGGATAGITGGAGNMTITAGTGASRTMTLQATTSGSAAQTFLSATDTAIALPSTLTSGLQLYNTADQTTNFERINLFWTGNEGTLSFGKGGTGTNRNLVLLGSLGHGFKATTSTSQIFLFNIVSNSATDMTPVQITSTSTATSGTIVGGLKITSTYNQASGNAANTDLKIARTETALGSGIQNFIQCLAGAAGTTEKFTVLNTGITSFYAGVATAGWGSPAIYGYSTIAGTTNARSAAVASYTVGAADGTFVVSGNVNVTTSTTHSFSLDCVYTDETNTSRTLVIPMAQLAGTFVASGLITNITGAGPYESASMTIRCKASTSITIRPSAGGTYTAVVYNTAASISQIG